KITIIRPSAGVFAHSEASIDTGTVPRAPTGTTNAIPEVMEGVNALNLATPGIMSGLPSWSENPAAMEATRGFDTERPISSDRTGRSSVLLSVGANAKRAFTRSKFGRAKTKLPYRPSNEPVRIAPMSKPATRKSGTPSPFVSITMSNSLSDAVLHRFHVFTAKTRKLWVALTGMLWTPTARRSFEPSKRFRGLERPQA